MKKIAILGAGFAGLSVAIFSLRRGWLPTIFDPIGLGGGASGVAAGLLHPFPGKEGRYSWRGKEGVEATDRLLTEVEKTTDLPLRAKTGIFRVPLFEKQKEDFAKNGVATGLCTWEKKFVGETLQEGIWIPSGQTIFSKNYLLALFLEVQKRGGKWVQEKVEDLSSLQRFDAIVVAAGEGSIPFSPYTLQKTLGQIFCVRASPALTVVGEGYVCPTEDPSICQLGSTYEHTEKTDPAKGERMRRKIGEWYPETAFWEILQKKEGTRVSPLGRYRPYVVPLGERAWLFTGLGSRGLLYHALLGEELVQEICK